MKKIIIIICLIFVVSLIKEKEYNIKDDSIRFRVIANSNSSRDILMKEKVVKELSSILFIKNNSSKETEKNIFDNLNNIERKIEILFKNNNYDENFNISYGLNEIPEKKYRGKKYKEGLYKSLVIEIGEGKGNNYFCILYPSLCVLDSKSVDKDNNYKSKLVEIINEILNVND